MFGFDRPEDGSQLRFRRDRSTAGRRRTRVRHLFWWVVHNCVSHPLIGLLPLRPFFSFHDWTSRRMHP